MSPPHYPLVDVTGFTDHTSRIMRTLQTLLNAFYNNNSVIMKSSRLSDSQLKKFHRLYLSGPLNITQTAKTLGIARNTLKRHIKLLRNANVSGNFCAPDARQFLKTFEIAAKPAALQHLQQLFSEMGSNIHQQQTVKERWQSYRELVPLGYGYSQFACYYASWLKSTPANARCLAKACVIQERDRDVLTSWRRSADHKKWEKAVVLLDREKNHAVWRIADKIERSPECVRHWLNIYEANGLSALMPQIRRTKAETTRQITLKKENLIRLLHEAPQLHGFNRTTWRLKDLSATYYKYYGMPVSMAMISVYIRQEGYVFRKARKVLTSPDPDFKEKLAHIQTILQNLKPEERFFSIDEYGPFSIKMKGGRALVKRGEFKTYPQHQPSKGCLICTAALELSTNQLTHFYSRKKNTDEMIKLIDLLLRQYHDQQKLYLSWDAAIWHASKRLYAHIEAINADSYRLENHSPTVELAPLPASAQFLNVIESVFSGLAKSVIHHSDYASVGHCQAAIDRYFRERNQHFSLHPKKAGKKIWGQERTVAEFRDHHNCKDPAWR